MTDVTYSWRDATDDTTPATGDLPVNLPARAVASRDLQPAPIMPTAIYHPAAASLGYEPPRLHADAIRDRRLPNPNLPTWANFCSRHWDRIWPGLLAAGWEGCACWCHSAGGHVGVGVMELLAGIAAFAGSGLTHHKHGNAAEVKMTAGMALVGTGLIALGTGTLTGPGPYALTSLFAMAGFGYLAHRLYHRSANRDDVTAHALVMAAYAGQFAAGGQAQIPSAGYSPAEGRLHAAFTALRIEPIAVSRIKYDDAHGRFTALISLPAGTNSSPEAVLNRRDQLCSNLRARQVAVHPAGGNQIRLTVSDGNNDPLADVVIWEPPESATIMQPQRVGLSADADPVALNMRRHILVAGETGGGKSKLLRAIICKLVALDDAVLWLCDLKPGQPEFGFFRPLANRFFGSVDEARLMFKAIRAAMEARGARLSELSQKYGKPIDEWDPTDPEHGPQLVVVIDELFLMFPELIDEFHETINLLRSYGGTLVVATQSPSANLFKTTDPKGQFPNVICLRTANPTQTNVILGPGMHGRGWDTSELAFPGEFYPYSSQHRDPVRCRGDWVDADMTAAVVERYREAASDKLLDVVTADAVSAELDGIGQVDGFEPDPAGPPPDGQYFRPYVVPPVTYHNGDLVEEHLQKAWKAFNKAGSLTIRELTAMGLPKLGSRESAAKALGSWVDRGYAWSDKDDRSERFYPCVSTDRVYDQEEEAS